MASNTKYNPPNVNEFEKSKLNINAQGVSATVSNGETSNLDYLLTDDCLLTGLVFFTSATGYGDYVQLQVVDTSGAFTGTAGTVMLQPATNWYVNPGSYLSMDADYPAKIPAGLTLRLVYTNTALPLGSTRIFMNYKLHKVLV